MDLLTNLVMTCTDFVPIVGVYPALPDLSEVNFQLLREEVSCYVGKYKRHDALVTHSEMHCCLQLRGIVVNMITLICVCCGVCVWCVCVWCVCVVYIFICVCLCVCLCGVCVWCICVWCVCVVCVCGVYIYLCVCLCVCLCLAGRVDDGVAVHPWLPSPCSGDVDQLAALRGHHSSHSCAQSL